ncbi:MAG: ATP-binding cassette domain-containing protein [Endomicrobium sp.]|jgi:D-methionine transport system ATP-binding protein|nr:ATP-binding cassette domain-containing protein [Endomicrobium sp.]
MIKLKNINKSFDSANGIIKVLDSISVEIKKGEIFGFIGYSGAGKSTLLRHINLLEYPTSGEVFVDGENLTELSQKEILKRRRKIGMIFQGYNLLYNATSFKNVAFPLEISGVKKPEIDRRVKESLKIVDLEDKIKEYPAKLSGGQKQRVAIARAIAGNPKILLCDEITAALDPETTESVLNYLKQINRNFGITIVIVTHEMEVARKLCSRVGVLENGFLAEIIDFANCTTASSKIGKYLFAEGGGI